MRTPLFIGSSAGRRRVAALLALLLVGCGPAGEREQNRPSQGIPVAGQGAPAAGADTGACVLKGRWALCSVLDRLDRAGLAPQPGMDTVRHPFMRVPGTRVMLGTGELQLFVYPDSAAAARDVRALDPALVAPPRERVGWPATPTLIVSNNLAAILLTDRERQIERVRDALTAGLPPADAP